MERQKYNQIINKYIKKDYIINAITVSYTHLVYLINDPFGGVQRLQTEQEVRILLDGRKLNSYAK